MLNPSPLVRKLTLVLALAISAGAAAHAADKPSAKPGARNAREQQGSPNASQPQTNEVRSPDRPPPESGRPAIGPRTTQGLAADAIARSNAP